MAYEIRSNVKVVGNEQVTALPNLTPTDTYTGIVGFDGSGNFVSADIPSGFDKIGIVDDSSNGADITNNDSILFSSGDGIVVVVDPNGTVTTSINTSSADDGYVLSYSGGLVEWVPNETLSVRYTETITPVINTAQTITHNLGTSDPLVQVRDVTTNEVVDVIVKVTSSNTIQITSSTTDQLRVVVI